MKLLNDHQTGRVAEIAADLLHKSNRDKNGTFHIALLTYYLLDDLDKDLTVADFKKIIRICGRIYREIPANSISGCSHIDYALAVARHPVHYTKLLALEPDDFLEAMAWLVADCRREYCGPLRFDILNAK